MRFRCGVSLCVRLPAITFRNPRLTTRRYQRIKLAVVLRYGFPCRLACLRNKLVVASDRVLVIVSCYSQACLHGWSSEGVIVAN